MWNWLNCYLSGRHDFGVTCASGSIFLRCIHCGKRSNGWSVHNEHPMPVTAPVHAPIHRQPAIVTRGLPYASREVVQHQQSA